MFLRRQPRVRGSGERRRGRRWWMSTGDHMLNMTGMRPNGDLRGLDASDLFK